MSVSLHIDALFADLRENTKETAIVEERITQAHLIHNYLTAIELTTALSELYLQHYSLQREIVKAFEIKERSKTRFQRLFNK